MQPNKQAAEKVMLDWVKLAQESKVPHQMKMSVTIMAYRTGILAWYDCPISTGKEEGINNKIILLSGKSLDAENMVFRSPLNRLVHCTSSKVSPLSILCKHIFSGQPLYTMIRSSEINRLSHIQSLSGA